MTSTHVTITPLIAEIVRETDMGDPWGSAMGWAGAVADRLHFLHGAPVPEGLGYVPAATGHWEPTSGQDDLLCEMNPSVADLTAAAEMLDTWLDLLKAAGRDY